MGREGMKEGGFDGVPPTSNSFCLVQSVPPAIGFAVKLLNFPSDPPVDPKFAVVVVVVVVVEGFSVVVVEAVVEG